MPNAKVLESKKAVVEALSGKIKEATSVVFVDYKGITVAQDAALRKQFRDAGVEYAVVKNTLTNWSSYKMKNYDPCTNKGLKEYKELYIIEGDWKVS